MSYSELYYVPKHGCVFVAETFKDSYRGAYAIWVAIGKRHLGQTWGADKLCELAWDETIPLYDRVMLACTFDDAIIPIEHAEWVCDQMVEWDNQHETEYPTHVKDWEGCIRSAASKSGLYGFAFNHTSVCADAWLVEDESGEDGFRMFDISRDDTSEILFISPEIFDATREGA